MKKPGAVEWMEADDDEKRPKRKFRPRIRRKRKAR
jgi:hypothetical protein